MSPGHWILEQPGSQKGCSAMFIAPRINAFLLLVLVSKQHATSAASAVDIGSKNNSG